MGGLAGTEREAAEELLLRACHIVRVTTNLLGHHDLAWIAVQQQLAVARRVGDPVLHAAAAWDLCGVLLHAAELDAARDLAVATVDQLDPLAGDGADRRLVALSGAMHLRAAVALSRKWNGADAEAHLAQARRLAAQVGEANVFQTMFGPSNTAIHGVEVALELGRPADVLTRADQVQPDAIGSGERRAHFWVLRAAGFGMARRDEQAIRALTVADRIAPQHVRNRPMARALVGDLLGRERRRLKPHLRTLATRMGVQ